MPRDPVSGKKPKTSPAEFVFTSAPMQVPVAWPSLTWIGEPQPEEVRRFMKAGLPLCQMT